MNQETDKDFFVWKISWVWAPPSVTLVNEGLYRNPYYKCNDPGVTGILWGATPKKTSDLWFSPAEAVTEPHEALTVRFVGLKILLNFRPGRKPKKTRKKSESPWSRKKRAKQSGFFLFQTAKDKKSLKDTQFLGDQAMQIHSNFEALNMGWEWCLRVGVAWFCHDDFLFRDMVN